MRKAKTIKIVNKSLALITCSFQNMLPERPLEVSWEQDGFLRQTDITKPNETSEWTMTGKNCIMTVREYHD